MSLLEEFADALLSRVETGLPPAAAHETRRTFLNVLGTAIGASRARDTDTLVSAASRLGPGTLEPLGRTESLDPYWAATVVGFAAHLDDFDDTHLETVIHPGAAVLGAWYALAADRKIDPSLALAAFAMGVESQLRVGLAMSPSHYDDGWHITGTCGVIGAAVTAAVAMGLDRAGLAAAIGLAAQMTLGHRESFGTPIKAFHAGKAAANGLRAAVLAKHGLRPGVDTFEEVPGFFGALAHRHDVSTMRQGDVAGRLVLVDNTYKPYPCGIVAHPAIEAAVELHRLVAAAGAAIADVVVDCNPLVPELMGRTICTTGLEARFCAIHGVAVGLLLGRAGLGEFSDERANDPRIGAARDRTHLAPDPTIGRESATVTVTFVDGSRLRRTVDVANGSAARPLTDTALVAKFSALVEPVFAGGSEELAALAMGLGETVGPRELRAAVRGRSDPAASRA